MRHFLWYRHDGSIGGAFCMVYGVPSDIDLSDAACRTCALDRLHRITDEEDLSGWYAYVCSCPASLFMCDCASQRMRDSFIENGTLRSKPLLSLTVNGQPWKPPASVTEYVAPAGSSLYVQFVCAVPDGHMALLRPIQGLAEILSVTQPLRFNKGRSPALEFHAPLPGLLGGVVLFSERVPFVRFLVRGTKP